MAAPTIHTQSASFTVYEGQTARFYVVAAGRGTITYQWEKSDNSGGSWSDVGGATSSSYTTAATVRTSDNGDQYRCKVTNADGTTTGTAITLTVWNPLAIGTDLQLWARPGTGMFTERSSPATSTTNGNPVGTWRGINGSSANVDGIAPSDAARPTYRSTGLNGTPALEFDGTDDVLAYTSALASAFQNKGYVYIFAGVSCTPSTSERVVMQAAVNATASSRCVLSLNQGSTSGRIAAGGRAADGDAFTSSTVASGFVTDEPMVVGAELLYGDTDCYTRKNQVREGSNLSFVGTATANSTSSYVGIGGLAASLFFDGMIGHVVVVTSSAALSSTNVAHIESFIEAQHNLPQLDWSLESRTGTYTAATVTNQVTTITPTGATQTENDLPTHRFRHYACITHHNGRIWLAHASGGTAEDNSGQKVVAQYSDDKGATWSSLIEVIPSQSTFSTANTLWPLGKRACFPRMFIKNEGTLYLITTINESGIDGTFTGIIGNAMLATPVNSDATMGTTVRISPTSYAQVDSKPLFSYDSTLGGKLFAKANVFGMHGGSEPSQPPSDWIGWESQGGVTFLELSTAYDSSTDPNSLVRLMRAFPTDVYNAVYMNRSKDGGTTRDWIRLTNAPNAPSVTRILRLKDGRFVIIGNQESNRTELYVALTSANSLRVNLVRSVINGVSSTPTYSGAGKNGGASYVDAVQVGNYLYLGYSLQKESFGFSRVLIPGDTDNNNDSGLISVTAPTLDQQVSSGTIASITATTSGTSGTYHVYLSFDGGFSFPLQIGTSVSLPFLWSVADSHIQSNAMIRIVDSSDSNIIGDSLLFDVIESSGSGSSSGNLLLLGVG